MTERPVTEAEQAIQTGLSSLPGRIPFGIFLSIMVSTIWVLPVPGPLTLLGVAAGIALVVGERRQFRVLKDEHGITLRGLDQARYGVWLLFLPSRTDPWWEKMVSVIVMSLMAVIAGAFIVDFLHLGIE